MSTPTVQAVPERPRLDPRCAHVAGDGRGGRCQLWAGHHGPHAVMFCRAGQRVVRAWTDEPGAGWRDLVRGYQALPWMLGYPVPAWQEGA